ncbi:hypothetical protein JCM9533A_62650 [Catenuloplanes niger JCM 9533]
MRYSSAFSRRTAAARTGAPSAPVHRHPRDQLHGEKQRERWPRRDGPGDLVRFGVQDVRCDRGRDAERHRTPHAPPHPDQVCVDHSPPPSESPTASQAWTERDVEYYDSGDRNAVKGVKVGSSHGKAASAEPSC